MSNMSDLQCASCTSPLERMRYFPRQLLTADDLHAEQAYFREKMRRHNRHLHGWGVACGCSVDPVRDAKGLLVRISPGYAVSPFGDEIQIPDAVDVDLQRGALDQPCTVLMPCPPTGATVPNPGARAIAYIAVRYAECHARPVRVLPAGCGCDETACEYSRVRETFEVKVLWALPESHRRAAQDDAKWCAMLRTMATEHPRESLLLPVPPCPECPDDPWVVLATVTLPANSDDAGDATRGMRISYEDRRVLLSTQRLQTAMQCLPR